MKILIVCDAIIPVKLYGGTQRVVWDLGNELNKLGHSVYFLVKKNSSCSFAEILEINPHKNIIDQIPDYIDIIHFHMEINGLEKINKPYIISIHGNNNNTEHKFDKNTVFISKNHASRYNSNAYVYNGLDWDNYIKPNLNSKQSAFHFLGKASWGVKNLKGSIDVINNCQNERLNVLGGSRFEKRVLKMGPKYFLSSKVSYKGMVGGVEKESYLMNSKGLIFPVLWHEPFGLAIIESLYYGCPVFGTPYGSLRELVIEEVGFLSNQRKNLAEAILNSENYNKEICHEYAVNNFNSKIMAKNYLKMYETVLNNDTINATPPQLLEEQTDRYLDFH